MSGSLFSQRAFASQRAMIAEIGRPSRQGSVPPAVHVVAMKHFAALIERRTFKSPRMHVLSAGGVAVESCLCTCCAARYASAWESTLVSQGVHAIDRFSTDAYGCLEDRDGLMHRLHDFCRHNLRV